LTSREKGHEEFYAVAEAFTERCLRKLDSLFTSGRHVWSTGSITELYHRVVDNPDWSKGSDFAQKLRGQLEGAPQDVFLLAAEALYILLLPQDTNPKTKRESVVTILNGAPEPMTLPDDPSEALEHGIASYGAALAHRFPQYVFLLEFAREWVQLPGQRREKLLSDPDEFDEFMTTLPRKGASSQVEALLHIVFPDYFEPIVSVGVKQKILQTFEEYSRDEVLPIDKRIALIRQELSHEYGDDFSFYDPEIQTRWNIKRGEGSMTSQVVDNWGSFLQWAGRLYENESFDRDERDYKLAAAQKLSQARAAFIADEDWLLLVREALDGNNLVNWRARDTFIDWCAEQSELATHAISSLWDSEEATEGAVDAFASRIRPDTAPGNRVNIASVLLMGVDAARYPPFRPKVDERTRRLLGISERTKGLEIDDGAIYRPDELAGLLGISGRTVRGFLRERFPRPEEDKNTDWHLDTDIVRAVVARFRPSATTAAGSRYFAFLELVDELLDRLSAHGVEVRDRLDAQSLLWWVTSGKPPKDWSEEDQAAFLVYQRGEETSAPTRASSVKGRELIPPVPDELAKSVYLPNAWLQEAIDILHEKHQVIFYGPPGTGKTFVAQALGQHVRAAGGDWQLVQFHPAYSYEDFFEGYRPSKSEDDGALQFDLQRGPLRLLAEQAASNPDSPYLLVIDEINRGNIAKIFGELYFLLEYRDKPIRLQYSPDQPFELPENLFLIGTMNTTDRSIALVDSALRRRFYFYPFLPRESPVCDVLDSWLDANGYDDEPARLLEMLNATLHEALPDDDFAFGPSYFMPSDGPPDLERIWRYAIHPLLEERFYGARQSAELEHDFDLAAMRARLLKAGVVVETSEEGDEEVGGAA
jgi:hypothetical protein